MARGIFTDKEHRPTTEEIFAAIGPSRPLWEGLARFIADNYRVQQDLGFYGKNYGWALRFRKGGKALLSLYPGREEFTVQIILGEAQVEEALGLALGQNVRKAIEDAHPYPEGRWLFIKVASKHDLDQVKQLLTVKAPLPKGR
jgi:hypothetical protein